MQHLKARHIFLLLVMLVTTLEAFAQSDAEHAARLFTRYDPGAAYNRVTEDLLTLSLSIKLKERTGIAIRVCSKESLPFALSTAGADPFHMAELLTAGYGYSAERVTFLRSEDCLSVKEPLRAATEIWTIPEGASLPTHVEALKSNQVKLVTLGKKPANRGVRDYRNAIEELIKNLRAKPESKGLVFGYFLERPSAMLRRRLNEVAKTLEQSGLPANRYLVRPMRWNDEVSTYPPDAEPQYPTVSIIEVARDTAQR